MKNQKWKFVLKTGILVTLLIGILIGIYVLNYWNLIPKKSYTANDFGIETLISANDKDMDGVDDYKDLCEGARNYILSKPKYESGYYEGGYPPQGVGVCTDVIWNAFQNAGYDLKELVTKDIEENPGFYPNIEEPDPNIDFRRVRNLKIFFDRNATLLTTDVKRIEEWQPGDIVIYPHHIAVVSDKRNKKGYPYIIHHGGQPTLEEDALTRNPIQAHYRWTGDHLGE